jgi:hypothetical protein
MGYVPSGHHFLVTIFLVTRVLNLSAHVPLSATCDRTEARSKLSDLRYVTTKSSCEETAYASSASAARSVCGPDVRMCSHAIDSKIANSKRNYVNSVDPREERR